MAEQLSRDLTYRQATINYAPPLPRLGRASSFRIKETNSYDVSDHFARIKHGIPAKLPAMCIEFPSLPKAKSFKCSYELRPANLADPVAGELHFAVELNDG